VSVDQEALITRLPDAATLQMPECDQRKSLRGKDCRNRRSR
jgi:hypothetical protein